MEEQQQAGKQRQRRLRGAAGGGQRGARAAAQGPHHGGRLTRSGAPRAGQPGHPRRGAAAANAAVATPASLRAEAGRGAGTRLLGEGGCGGCRSVAGAALRSGLRHRGRGGAPSRGAAEPGLRVAARSRRGATHHLPPGRRWPARLGRGSGAPEAADSSGRGAAGQGRPSASARSGAAAGGGQPSGGSSGSSSSAGQLLTPARGEPGGRRKRSRRPLLPPPPPEAGAPAGEGGEVVPGDFSGPVASRGRRGATGV